MRGATSSFKVETRKRRTVTVPPRATPPYPAHRWGKGNGQPPITTVGEAATITVAPPKAPPVEAAFPESSREPPMATAPPTPGETKRERFYRLITGRMKKMRWSIDQVGYCADPERYDPEKDDVKLIQTTTLQWVNSMFAAFGLPLAVIVDAPNVVELRERTDAVFKDTLADVTRELDAVRDATMDSLRHEASTAKAAAEKLEAKVIAAGEEERKRRAELLDEIRVKVTQAIAEGHVVPLQKRSPLAEMLGIPVG